MAATFEVSVSFVIRLVQRWRTIGSARVRGTGGRPRHRLEVHGEPVDGLLVVRRDTTLEELLPSAKARALANFSVQRASVSFCAALAGFSGQISAALLPASIASFSAAMVRCLGAATSVASTICPPIGRQPRAAAREADHLFQV
ncbi:MAG: hypothetical protein H5U21_07560, partial [Porphyrobacter sp.]|nr:hypothetical protein [Porphyrobacter sp.]